MAETYSATPDIEVLTTNFPIPGFGLIPVNAFVLKGAEPILVDSGPVVMSDEFWAALESVIDPGELKWIFLTHTDLDHIGCIGRLLEANPDVRLITTFIGVGIMSTAWPLPLNRVYLLNPGDTLTIGNRTLRAFKPPAFDNPSTTGFLEESSGILFSSDCFGAVLQDVPQNAADLTDEQLRDGQTFWTTVDSPWIHKVDEKRFAKELDGIRALKPEMVLSSHLPPAGADQTDRLLASLAAAPSAPTFVGPDQAALEQMLKEMTAGPQ